MEKLYVKRPIYPLISLLSSVAVFCIGLLVSKRLAILYLLAALTLIYILFGYTRVLVRAIPLFLLIGTVIGAGAVLTSRQYMAGIQTLGRTLLLAYSSVVMVALPPVNLTRNLAQLRLPRILTLGMLITIRFVPLLINEIKQITEAMKTRGVKVRIYHLPYLYRAFLLPFLMRLISISEIMAVSIETRGFALSDTSYSVYKQVRFEVRDGVFALSIAAVLAGVMIYG
ncbi:energy-coupling factor transport system permease protein [Anaerotaenia torta]|uniref:energy-coupling factor transporter transmembrane component T family protein n=1 Tax=Anaerotaenia torta TaxID=433293 RepID=UPI003D200AB9